MLCRHASGCSHRCAPHMATPSAWTATSGCEADRPRPSAEPRHGDAGSTPAGAAGAAGRGHADGGGTDRGHGQPPGRARQPRGLRAEPADPAAAAAGGAVHQPLSTPSQPASPVQSPVPMPGGSDRPGLDPGAGRCRRLERSRPPLAGRRATPPSSLLPKARWGSTPHERLNDAPDLSRILEAELNSDLQQNDRRRETPEAPLDATGDTATASERGEP